MANLPTAVIVCDVNGVPVSAKCSACGEEMPQGEPRGTTRELSLKWFQQQFALHSRQKHPREDVNQAAARVVREATKD